MKILSVKHTRILLWLARYKYLCTEQIHLHLFPNNTVRAVQHALEYLDKHGYIKRAKLPKSKNLNFGYLSYLTKQGLELVQNEQQSDNYKYIKYTVTKPFSSINHYYHRYQLINFWIKLEADLRQLPMLELKTILTESGQKKIGKKSLIETKLIMDKLSIIPDMIFILKNIKTQKEALYMVEIDTGKEAIGGQFNTIPKGSLLYKYKIYEKFLQSLSWQKQLETTAQTFQVLTVTERKTHLETLMKRIQENMTYPDHFLGSTHESIKQANVFTGVTWFKSNSLMIDSLL
ncbi:replication-relaxation family protein [Kordia sp.]|uniref:replication-relaxation family protein n=1 Tax=Kordia sp. TaxID=1965332 RepID=UPI003D6A8DB8